MTIEMRATSRLNVLGASRYEFEGIRGMKVYAQKDSDAENLNVVGIEVVEFGADFDLFEEVRGYGFPMEFDCDLTFGRGARGKSAARITKFRPVGKPAAPAATGKAASS